MAAPDLAGFLKVGLDVMSTTVHPKTKKLLAQLGHVGKETTDPDTGKMVSTDASTESDNAEIWQQPGIVSRAPKPEKGQTAPQAVALCMGDHDVVIAQQDERGRDLYGSLGYGETSVYGAGADGKSQGRSLYKDDGSVTHLTRKGNTKDGVAIMMQLDASGSIRLMNDKGYGIIIGPSDITISAGDASLKLTGSGNVSLVGKGKTLIDGSTVLIGSLAVPIVNNAITGPAGIVGKASLKVLIEAFFLGIGFAAAVGLAHYLT